MPVTHMYLGAHMPISGGLHLAIERIKALEGTALQIFTRNQRQWRIPELTGREIGDFAAAWAGWGPYPIAAHDSYLINLASPREEAGEKSIAGFAAELGRVEGLGMEFLVTHPGAHLGDGAEAGLHRYAARLDEAIERSGTERALVLLENTAGQGTVLGGTFEELARIAELSRHPERIGVCLDTCHAWAAGYDLSGAEGCATALARLDGLLGAERLRFMHLNDCLGGLGAHLDRHADIGQGTIGLEGFAYFMNAPRLADVPKVIETPKDKDGHRDRLNLETLRGLRGQERDQT